MPAILTYNILTGAPDWSPLESFFEARFPPSHLTAGTPGLVARWREGEDKAGRHLLQVGFGARPVDVVAILATNITDPEGLQVIFAQSLPLLQAGATWNYEIPAARWKDGSAWLDLTAAGLPPWPVGAMALMWSGSRAGTEGGDPLQMGALWVGKARRLPYSWRWGAEAGHDQIAVHYETEIGSPISHPLATRRVWTGDLPPRLSEAEAELLASIHRELRGRARSALFIPELDGLEVAQVRLGSDEWRRQAIAPGVWGASELTLVEEAFGEPGV